MMKSRNDNLEQNKQESLKHIPWVTGRPDGYYFIASPLDINATPAAVWDMVKKIDGYNHFSKGSITASIPQGELKVNNTIHLVLYPNQCVGTFIPASDERISVVDNENHVVAWERALPFGGTTECYRVLEPLDGGNKTRSYIALKIPSFVGFFTHHLLKNKIEDAFNLVNHGIKNEAERQEASLV